MEDLKELKERFDVKSYLSDLGIRWSGTGDNVGEGWIGMQCIYCGDKLNHLGINLKGKYFKCWQCNETGDIVRLIRDLEDVGFSRAKERLKQYESGLYVVPKGNVIQTDRKQVKLPPFAKRIEKGNEPKAVKMYLKRRKFPLSLCQHYDFHYCAMGSWRLYLIVPIYYRGTMVSFQAVDVTGKRSLKYKNCPKDWAVIQNRHLVCGLDAVTTQCILVEGLTDMWRFGDGACAMFGKNYTMEQVDFLAYNLDRNFKIKVILDADAYRRNRKLVRSLPCYFSNVVEICIRTGDPDKLSTADIKRIKAL